MINPYFLLTFLNGEKAGLLQKFNRRVPILC
jgi:hypothetical protein